MDLFLFLGCILLISIVLVYLGTIFTLYIRQNPTSTPLTVSSESNKSIVTHTYLGTRGDMGNQLFQLACIIAAGKRSHANIVFPARISLLPISKLFDLSPFEWRDVIPDATFYEYDNYEEIIIPEDGRIYDVRGYRQSYQYFEDFASVIRNTFVPRAEILEAVRDIVPKEYITVHIRKGDYVKLMHKIPLLREFRRCQLEYYKAGIRELRERYSDCPLLVCTDSPEWVTPLLSELDSNAMIAPVPQGVNPKFSDFIVMYLAAGCVISNSSYSFWSSYLNPGRMIICPSPWWDSDGFIGTTLALDSNLLHHPEWWLLDADTGKIVREPHSTVGDRPNNNHETLNIYRLARGLLL